MRKFTQFFALGLLLIVAPVGSWYYLNKGYNERKEALDQLQDYGKIEVINSVDTDGQLITKDSLQQRFSIVGFTDNFSTEAQIMKHTELLYKQFGKDGGVALVTYLSGADSVSLSAYASENASKKDGFWYLVNLPKEQYQQMRNQIYPDSLRSGNYFAFVDTSLTIRNYYDVTDISRVGELAKHVAMFVAPTKARPDLEFRREQEK